MTRSHADRHPGAHAADATEPTAPGRRTLTMGLPTIQRLRAPSLQHDPHRPVQLQPLQLQRMMDDAMRPDLHASASRAIAGSAGPLPFGDAIQASFGRHDVGGIQAHTDASAAAGTHEMGALAFAMGDHVAFGAAPDLHTAAHEAAHVVQQRGGVQCKGGIGEEGDAYEQHADAVADAVVAGRSAEALLDRYAGPAQLAGAAPSAIQAVWLQHGGTPFLRWDTLVNGLRWYLDPRTGDAFFQIEGDPGLDEEPLGRLERLEGPARARTIEQWCTTTTLFEPSPSREPAPVAESDDSLGPTTARGVPIPRVGFGTDIELTEEEKASLGTDDEHVLDEARAKKTYATLSDALGAGYTLFDTAFEYGSMGVLGRAIAESGVPPQDVFVVYKIKPSEVLEHFQGDLARAVIAACRQLGREYVDVLMLHDLIGPPSLLASLAEQMQMLRRAGIARYLGASNVATTEQLDLVATQGGHGAVGVSFVQNKMHPHRQDQPMRQECEDRGITYMGYSIMGSGQSTGKCGHVISSEPIYDVRSDGALRGLAEEEGLPGAGELAIAWGVNEGTVQIPKTSNPRRMVENRRAGRQTLSPETMRSIEAMDDVITDDDQLELTEHMDVPKNQLRLKLPNKSKWHALDRLYAAGLQAALDTIGAAVGADQEASTAFVELMTYVSLIDGGFCASDALFRELRERILPGDYSRIVLAFGGRPAVATLKGWWANAGRGGGCPIARTRVMGYIANGLPPDSDFLLDQEDAQQGVGVVDSGVREVTIAFGDLLEIRESFAQLVVDDEYYAKYEGKQIAFDVLEKLAGDRVRIRITRTFG